MASEGIFLSAHQGEVALLEFFDNSVDARAKGSGISTRAIIDYAIAAICFQVLWAAAQFLSEKKVLDAGELECCGEFFAVKVRETKAAGIAAHVDQ